MSKRNRLRRQVILLLYIVSMPIVQKEIALKLWCSVLLRAFMGVLLLAPVAALAWGAQGHQVVATLAQMSLTPEAGAAVNRLLALEPGQTLAFVSTWADEHRDPATTAWHYVNFPKASCSYEPARDCPDGNCVVGALNKQLEILASGAPDSERLLALKYVVHLVGDVHQPLHAGYAQDRGGNRYQVQAFGEGTNLHSLWDFGMIRNLHVDTTKMSARLRMTPLPSSRGELDVARFAEESCRIVGMPGFYPERKIDEAYIERFTPIMEQRLSIAGARLAGLLNRLFK